MPSTLYLQTQNWQNWAFILLNIASRGLALQCIIIYCVTRPVPESHICISVMQPWSRNHWPELWTTVLGYKLHVKYILCKFTQTPGCDDCEEWQGGDLAYWSCIQCLDVESWWFVCMMSLIVNFPLSGYERRELRSSCRERWQWSGECMLLLLSPSLGKIWSVKRKPASKRCAQHCCENCTSAWDVLHSK